MCPPFCLHNIRLARPCWKTCRRPAPHYVNYHTGHLCHTGKAKSLLHQRKPGTTCSGHRLETSKRSSNNSGYTCYLIFHLNEYTTHFGQPCCCNFQQLCRWCYRIACKESATSIKCPFSTGLITLHKFLSMHSHISPSIVHAQKCPVARKDV